MSSASLYKFGGLRNVQTGPILFKVNVRPQTLSGPISSHVSNEAPCLEFRGWKRCKYINEVRVLNCDINLISTENLTLASQNQTEQGFEMCQFGELNFKCL